jgi:hypothetical protein
MYTLITYVCYLERHGNSVKTTGSTNAKSNLIKIILVRHTSYNEDDLEAPSSVINK